MSDKNKKFSNSTFNKEEYDKLKTKDKATLISEFSNSTPLCDLPIDTEIEPSDNTVSRV